MFTPPQPDSTSSNPLSRLVHTILSYDGNIMLAAIISLLLVILFVLLLHVYAKWFLARTRTRTRSRNSVTVPRVHLGTRSHHFHSFTVDSGPPSSPAKGLESAVVASIPLFVYKEYKKIGLECVICLSGFEEEEMGRKLPRCGHAFHVECIDMWLHSHSTCPICRENVVVADNDRIAGMDSDLSEDGVYGLEIVVEAPNLEHENVAASDSLSACSSSSLSSPVPSLGGSLKRMMSKSKIHPSITISELDS